MSETIPKITMKQMVEWLNRLKQHYERVVLRNEFSLCRSDIAIIDAILAALEPKITKDQIEQLSYSFEWKDKDELRERIIPEQLARVLGLPLDQKCEDCTFKRKAALEPKAALEKSWMKLAEELNVPFSAVKIIRDKLYTEMEGPGEAERKGLVEHFDKHMSFVIGGKDACPTCVKIRALLLGEGAEE